MIRYMMLDDPVFEKRCVNVVCDMRESSERSCGVEDDKLL